MSTSLGNINCRKKHEWVSLIPHEKGCCEHVELVFFSKFGLNCSLVFCNEHTPLNCVVLLFFENLWDLNSTFMIASERFGSLSQRLMRVFSLCYVFFFQKYLLWRRTYVDFMKLTFCVLARGNWFKTTYLRTFQNCVDRFSFIQIDSFWNRKQVCEENTWMLRVHSSFW